MFQIEQFGRITPLKEFWFVESI